MYRLKSYTGVAMLPTAFLASGFHKIELRPSRTKDFAMCSLDPPSLLCYCNFWIASKIFVCLAR